jgi:hypothetical protein
MRMWMINPRKMCPQHLVGEHFEIHKHRHNFVKRHRIDGRVKPVVLIEPLAMKKRHDELAKYLKNHKSPYSFPDLSYIPMDQRNAKVDQKTSLDELSRRCPECKKLIETKETSV